MSMSSICVPIENLKEYAIPLLSHFPSDILPKPPISQYTTTQPFLRNLPPLYLTLVGCGREEAGLYFFLLRDLAIAKSSKRYTKY